MKLPASLVFLLAALFAFDATAQLTVRIGKDGGYRSGSYEGYWSPTYTPPNFRHELTTVKFENETRAPVSIYHIDRYNSWNWTETVRPGEAVRVTVPVGDVLAVRGREGRILQRIVARPGRQTVQIRTAGSYYDGDRYGPQKAQRFDVVIRNKTRQPITLYALQPWEEWVWVGRIPSSGGELEVRAYDGQDFRVLDQRGRVLERFQADRRDRRVSVD